LAHSFSEDLAVFRTFLNFGSNPTLDKQKRIVVESVGFDAPAEYELKCIRGLLCERLANLIPTRDLPAIRHRIFRSRTGGSSRLAGA
jgi:hypothetical protein